MCGSSHTPTHTNYLPLSTPQTNRKLIGWEPAALSALLFRILWLSFRGAASALFTWRWPGEERTNEFSSSGWHQHCLLSTVMTVPCTGVCSPLGSLWPGPALTFDPAVFPGAGHGAGGLHRPGPQHVPGVRGRPEGRLQALLPVSHGSGGEEQPA